MVLSQVTIKVVSLENANREKSKTIDSAIHSSWNHNCTWTNIEWNANAHNKTKIKVEVFSVLAICFFGVFAKPNPDGKSTAAMLNRTKRTVNFDGTKAAVRTMERIGAATLDTTGQPEAEHGNFRAWRVLDYQNLFTKLHILVYTQRRIVEFSNLHHEWWISRIC